jgi:hypothetical protein
MSSSRISRPAAALAGFLVVLVALGLAVSDAGHTQASHTGGMDAMSIDVDVTGNTATSLGPRDSCVEAGPGDVVTVDVTATNIPATMAMIAFTYTIQYDESRVWVETQNHQFLLAANVGSGLFNLSELTPDQNLNNQWNSAVADLSDSGVIPPEYGSGVLSRLSIGVSQSTPDGTYALTLTEAGHVDTMGEPYPADVLNQAAIAVGVSCPPVVGTPTPVPTPTPLPTPTPRPPAISVSFEPEAQLRPQDDSVTVRGTISCSAPGPVDIEVVVQQYVKGERVVAAAPNSDPILCEGQASWSATVRPEYGPEYGRLRPGYGEVLVIASASGSGEMGGSGPIYLKPGAVK